MKRIFWISSLIIVLAGLLTGVVILNLRATKLRKKREEIKHQEIIRQKEFARKNPHIIAKEELWKNWKEIGNDIKHLHELETTKVPAYFKKSRHRECKRLAGQICRHLKWMEKESLKWEGKMELPVSLKEIRTVSKEMEEILKSYEINELLDIY